MKTYPCEGKCTEFVNDDLNNPCNKPCAKLKTKGLCGIGHHGLCRCSKHADAYMEPAKDGGKKE